MARIQRSVSGESQKHTEITLLRCGGRVNPTPRYLKAHHNPTSTHTRHALALQQERSSSVSVYPCKHEREASGPSWKYDWKFERRSYLRVSRKRRDRSSRRFRFIIWLAGCWQGRAWNKIREVLRTIEYEHVVEDWLRRKCDEEQSPRKRRERESNNKELSADVYFFRIQYVRRWQQ